MQEVQGNDFKKHTPTIEPQKKKERTMKKHYMKGELTRISKNRL